MNNKFLVNIKIILLEFYLLIFYLVVEILIKNRPIRKLRVLFYNYCHYVKQ